MSFTSACGRHLLIASTVHARSGLVGYPPPQLGVVAGDALMRAFRQPPKHVLVEGQPLFLDGSQCVAEVQRVAAAAAIESVGQALRPRVGGSGTLEIGEVTQVV